MNGDFVFDFNGILNSTDGDSSSVSSNPDDGDDCNSSDGDYGDGGIRR